MDDSYFLAEAATPQRANKKLTRMLTRKGGALQWAKDHFVQFELDKSAHMIFSRRKQHKDRGRNLIIEGTKIPRVNHTKHLGVILDNKLNFSQLVGSCLHYTPQRH